MKWRPERFVAAAALLAVGFTMRAELAQWIQAIPSPSALEAVFFRSVPLAGGSVPMRRPSRETRAELTKLIAASPSDAELYALRAREDEQQLDFAAAENDWNKYVESSADRPHAELALADFFHRRLRPRDEIAALEAVGRAPSPSADKFTPAPQQRSWLAFERILTVVSEQLLPFDVAARTYREWVARYPAEASVQRRFFDALLAARQWSEAEKQIAVYGKIFSGDSVYPVQAEAALAWRRGSLDDAVKIYDRGFRPLWPPELVKSYFDLLKQSHALREYLKDARARAAADPAGLNAAARLFYYYQQQGNLVAAQRALLEYRQRKDARKSPWGGEELFALGQWFEATHNYDEAARSYYALYSAAPNNPADQERALASLAALLLAAPEQPVQFGSGDLSLYRDIGQADPYPGFLNGVLSLILNSTEPVYHYSAENTASLAYFHRAKAAELIGLIDSRFPASGRRAELHARLIDAYAAYGDNDGVIRAGRAFLAAFPKAEERTRVAFAMADAYARKEATAEEFAIYDDLLKELAARAEGRPLGEAQPTEPARSPEYARVLDRYISRLVSLKRVREALALYRGEIGRNPGDPGLYERLAAFLEQNRLGVEIVQVYRQAMAQFPDSTWSHKLARWYLRHKQAAQFEQLTRDVAKIFSNTDLEAYIAAAAAEEPPAPVLYRQVNLYAHQRFPYDQTFVRNLLSAYSQQPTYDAKAYEALLRQNWFYANDLRDRFFEFLSSTKRLQAELSALPPASAANPAAEQFAAEAEAWRSHFEAAAPRFRTLAAAYPANLDCNTRAAALYRSLSTLAAPGDLNNVQVAVEIEENLARYDPLASGAPTRLGEIYADRELFARARPYWNRLANMQPGRPDGYVEAATVFWDYFQFDDALRVIGEGRRKLSNPTLFAYEAGAIYENQRNSRRAIEEYASGALAANGEGQARARLIELARRPLQRSAVDAVTAQAAAAPNPSIAAVSLRADVLEAQNRRADLENFLLATAGRSDSLDLLSHIEQLAVRQGFESVQERALRRRIAALTDPVEQTRERLALARFYEGRRDIASAGRVIAELYHDRPALLGVIRAAVDFHWRTQQRDEAIAVLESAADRAQAPYKTQFTFEAARKSTDAGQYERARKLLATLLQAEPFQPEYLAAMADAFARAGDDAGLRQFYQQKMDDLRAAPLAAPERAEKTAALRRGLIPVLTRLKDYAGAVDQYIEILKRYPDDDGLAREAAAYSSAHGRAPQLLDYFAKAAKESPKDYRWPMVLARMETQLEDFPAAIAAYTRAAEIRPDRVDLFAARASLEERLLRFEDAAATYAKLYDLSYHNSQWMEKLAETRARQGQTDAAVKALRTALIDGRPARPELFFAAASRFESWGWLPQAREYAEQGVALAGDDLLGEYLSGAQTYARVLTRLRRHATAYRKLMALGSKQSGEEGPPAGLAASLREIGAAVNFYSTPAEKSAFAVFLASGSPKLPEAKLRILLPVATAAGLADLRAKWQYELAAAAPSQAPAELASLQTQRLRYTELGGQLEAYWKIYPAEQSNRDSLLTDAARYYRLAGDPAAELRILSQLDRQAALSDPPLVRYAELLTARAPANLLAVAAGDTDANVRDGVTNYAIESGPAAHALAAIAARGRGLPPVWMRAYTGLVGLYFANPAAQISTAFREALGTATIGERLGKRVDTKAQLAGSGWFYYGTSFGEYLAATKQSGAADFLPALLEATPGRAQAYFDLAEYYRQSGQGQSALAEYRNALQLNARRGDAHNRIAVVLWGQGRREEAAREWAAAIEAFAWQQDQRSAPPDFWQTLPATLEDLGRFKALDAVRPAADKLLRTYIHRNGSYQVEPLLRGALAAPGDPAAGVAWIVDLSRAAPDRVQFLDPLTHSDWIPDAQMPLVWKALMGAAQDRVAAANGEARDSAEIELRNWQIQWAEFLVARKQPREAAQALAEIPDAIRTTRQNQIAPLRVRIAALTVALQTLLDKYRASAIDTLPLDDLQRAAGELKTAGDESGARQVLEFVYTARLESRDLSAATFLGLADIRLEQGDAAAALALLRRMTLVTGEPFDNLVDAAELLKRTGHPAEAAQFLSERVRAVPWDDAARLRLAEALLAADKDRDEALRMLRAAAESNQVAYDTRAAAAVDLAAAKARLTGADAGAELNLLSSGAVAATDAEKPYFYHARIAAAKQTSDAAVRIRLLRAAIAIAPDRERDKLALFDAAFGAKRYSLAIGALYPLLAQAGLGTLIDGETGWALSSRFPADAATARRLAEAFAKENQPGAAAALYRMSFKLEPTPDAKRELDRLDALLERRRLNKLRRPVISSKLEQERLVLPRLTASAVQGGQP